MTNLDDIRALGAPERFRYFIRAREEARLMKELIGGDGPWAHSTDPIIAVNRFCNVNREHDAVTRWVARHVRERYRRSSPSFLLVQCLVARIWNHPPTLQAILPVGKTTGDIQETLKMLRWLKSSGEKTMRGAYMMPVHGPGGKGKSADEYFLAAVAEAHTVNWRQLRSYEAVASRLLCIRGLGPFLVNQVIADLRYCERWRGMPDWHTFVLCGPGTRRGLDRYTGLCGSKLGTGAQEAYVRHLLEIRHVLLLDCVNGAFYDPNNVANCFCEWDKYERVLQGETRRLHSYP